MVILESTGALDKFMKKTLFRLVTIITSSTTIYELWTEDELFHRSDFSVSINND